MAKTKAVVTKAPVKKAPVKKVADKQTATTWADLKVVPHGGKNFLVTETTAKGGTKQYISQTNPLED